MPAERSVIDVLGERIALGPLRKDLVPAYHRWMTDFQTLRTLGAPSAPTA